MTQDISPTGLPLPLQVAPTLANSKGDMYNRIENYINSESRSKNRTGK